MFKGFMKDSFAEQYKHPKWQKTRLRILENDDFACRHCCRNDVELHVHHLNYKKGHKIWEYKQSELITLCKSCHEETTKAIERIRSYCGDDTFVKCLNRLCMAYDGKHGYFVPAILNYLSLKPEMIFPIFSMLQTQKEQDASTTPKTGTEG